MNKIEFFPSFKENLLLDYNNFIQTGNSEYFEEVKRDVFKYTKPHYPDGNTLRSDPYAFNKVVRVYFNNTQYIHAKEILFMEIESAKFTFFNR